jgi:DNA-directed RNA polymerase specialized sigma subunit
MNSNKSFSQRLQEGASQEELKKEYGLSEREFIKVMESLKDIHNSKVATQGRSYGQVLPRHAND